MAEKKDGTCCGCGYSWQEETPCAGSDDGTLSDAALVAAEVSIDVYVHEARDPGDR